MSKLEKYSSYKNSGVEWLGDIPSEWKTLANKHIFKIKQNLVGKKSGEYDLLSLTLKGIIKRNMDDPKGKFPAEFDTYQEVKKDDFVFCLFDVEETPRTVGLSKYDGMITGAYTVMQTKGMSQKYLYYFYLNLDSSKRFKPLYKGLRNTIPKDSFFSFKTFIPPKQEQRKIASFLDIKIEQLDKAIKQKEQLIELLKERRQILINDAVTKGIDKTVTMKDSGVEWIGEIPEHWEVKKLKFMVSKVSSGVTPSGGALSYLSEGIPLLRSQNILFEKIDYDNAVYISNKTHNKMKNSQVKFNDVLLNITGGSIGRCNFVDVDMDLNVNQHVCIIRPKKTMYTILLNNILASAVGQTQIWSYQQGGGREGLNFEAIKKFDLPIPPKQEQECIVNYLEIENQKIDKAIDLQQQQIIKLKEYKTTLIDSVVTGKVKAV
jgi:type I restriction enzyme S subunit